MFSYFEPNFIEKIFLESGFSNFGQVTIFAKWKLVHYYFENVNVFDIVFADLWLF